MSTTALRIVLDTNILVAIIGRKSPFRWIFDAIIRGDIVLCISTEILLEYQEILEEKTSQDVAENVVNFITVMPTTERFEIYYAFSFIESDPDDNKFVNCAIAANAQFLVSNDRQYEALKQIDFPVVNWITLPAFEQQFKDMFTS